MTNKLIGPKGSDVPETKGKNELKGRELLAQDSGLSRTYKSELTGYLANNIPVVVGGYTFLYEGKTADGAARISIEIPLQEKIDVVCPVGERTKVPDNQIEITPQAAGNTVAGVTIKVE